MGLTAYERLITASAAYVDPGWLPPEDECPALAHLRRDHVRLLGTVQEKLAAQGDLHREQEEALRAREATLHAAFLTGDTPSLAEANASAEEELAAAAEEYRVACDALETFVRQAEDEIRTRAPEVRQSLHEMSLAAEAKRAEARRLLEEAERLAAAPRKLLNWLDRYTGKSYLGPIQWTALGVPAPEPMPELVQELARLTPGDVIAISDADIDDDWMEDTNA
jgi:hypothetical protein